MTHLSTEEIKELKEKLEDEKAILTNELSAIGHKNATNPSDWEANPDEMEIQEADRNEAADRVESFEQNTAILKELEIRFNNVKKALANIEKGTYGICEEGGEPIKKERLYANPAAYTCTKHMGE